MPQWICPFCSRVLVVCHSKIGEILACENCRLASEVVDVERTEPVGLFCEWQLPRYAFAKRTLAVLYAIAWIGLSLLVLVDAIKISGVAYWIHLGRGFASAVAFLLVSWPVRPIASQDCVY